MLDRGASGPGGDGVVNKTGVCAQGTSTSPISVLLVEGSKLDRAAVEAMLDAVGLAPVVRVAAGVTELRALLRTPPDVVVIDATAAFTESTAAAAMREVGAGMPLIVVGAAGADDAPGAPRARLSQPEGLAELVLRICPGSSRRAGLRLGGFVDDYPLLFEQNPDAMWLFDLDSLRFLATNEAAGRKYGYSPEQFLGLTLLDLCPPDQVPLLRRYFERAALDVVSGESRVRDFQHRRRDGSIFDVEITWGRVDWHRGPAGLAVAIDVSAASRGERLVLGQNGLLDMIARGEPLAKVLEALVLLAERELPGLLGSVLLLDDDGLHIRHGASPSLPVAYTNAIDGVAIGPRVGSCGTAAYYGEAVIVPDIRTDPRWDGYRDYALPHQLVACWSTPIKAASGKVLGTFALYHRDPRSPTGDELAFVEIVTAVARIAIEREHTDRARRDAAEALRRSASAQAAILDALPAHIAVIDGDGVVLAVNQAWGRLGGAASFPGWTCGVGANYLDTLERTRAARAGEVNEVETAVGGVGGVLGGRAAQFETEVVWQGAGERRWYRLVVTPLVAGELRGAVVMYLDVTPSKLAEESVRESQDRYRQIFENDVTGDLVSLPDGTIVECNPAFARIFGFAEVHEARGNNEAALFPVPGMRAAVMARLHEEQTVASLELELRRRDGKPVWVLATVVGSFGPQHELRRVSWYFLDRTEQKHLEQQLRQAQKMEAVGLLAGGVAHDFNNVLTVINSCSELMLKRIDPGDPWVEMLTEIQSAGERASELTQQLLAFGRKQVLRPVKVDLNELVTGVEKMLRRLLGEDVGLHLRLEPLAGIVYADWGQIEQVVVNLAVNARDAMPKGGRLMIETRVVVITASNAALHPGVTPGSYLALIVRDEGLGMDAETCARIFEPFFTTKESGKGSGLGLAIVYGIVQQSGGFVGVESAPGAGTTFTAYLPRGEGAADRRDRSPPPSRSAIGTETVLLAEDEDSIRVLCRHALTEHGYRVLEARHGQEALELCTSHAGSIDILVTDVVMPKMSGRALADRVRVLRPDIKVLYVSGYTDDAIMRHGASEAQVAFLPKPFTTSVLLHRIREVLDRS